MAEVEAGKAADFKSDRRTIAELIAPGSFASGPEDYGWKDDDDGWRRFANTVTFGDRCVALRQADRILASKDVSIHVKRHPYENAAKAIAFALEVVDKADFDMVGFFLTLWSEGDWKGLDREFLEWKAYVEA